MYLENDKDKFENDNVVWTYGVECELSKPNVTTKSVIKASLIFIRLNFLLEIKTGIGWSDT